jgi:hypothetical protein
LNRSGVQQASLAKALINVQGNITAGGYEQQSLAAQAEAMAANTAGSSASILGNAATNAAGTVVANANQTAADLQTNALNSALADVGPRRSGRRKRSNLTAASIRESPASTGLFCGVSDRVEMRAGSRAARAVGWKRVWARGMDRGEGRRPPVGAGRDRAGQARFANVPKNPLISRGVYKTVCQSIRLINKKNFNPSPSSGESVRT